LQTRKIRFNFALANGKRATAGMTPDNIEKKVFFEKNRLKILQVRK